MVLSDSQLSRGVFDLLTIWSDDPTTLPDGTTPYRVDRYNQLQQLLGMLTDSSLRRTFCVGSIEETCRPICSIWHRAPE